ncbi:MAG: hypothetical protein IPL61_35750 [Myxococcales bacterium]|nr:hypothetical protein [Myxococcales bacterium]
MRAPILATCSILVAVAVAGCGGDDGGSGDPDAGGIDAMLGDPTVLVGTFAINLVDDDPPNTTITGTVYDRTPPALVLWDVTTTDGDCQLLIPHVPFCATPCGSTAACVADDVCAPNAMRQDVGTVHVTGVHTTTGASEFDLIRTTDYLVPGTITLLFPGFAPGDPITVAASGAAFTPAFTMATVGIAPLVVTSPDPALMRGAAVDLGWTAPASGATSRIAVKLDISHHGGLKGKIVCDTADDGALTLGGAMITQLLDLGAAGFPTIELTRTISGSGLTTAGRVDLTISSAIERAVTVPGITSCTGDEDCTPPATCQSDLTCQ